METRDPTSVLHAVRPVQQCLNDLCTHEHGQARDLGTFGTQGYALVNVERESPEDAA
jgi:hypothetical protein